ncbi:surface carbohydrate biosynthesis protein [Fredinandcohnia onubensis]|uniref:surface carbohydrate biosynthesis protein n=1 Tax=Fredinandcohnia onubensis TaxID=1571209 RepID=UPI0015D47982|nr:surface carbohydrate biosynthesis protein [Fredinandcohnia onubensis]
MPVETKVRELDAKLLLAYYAVKENFRVIIGEHTRVERASFVFPNGIFFSKGYPNRYRKRVLGNAKKYGHILVELDEEGLIINDTSNYLKDRMRHDLLTYVDQEYCWGKFQEEIITNSYPQFREKCHIVGNPRFDLLKEKFHSLYKDSADKIQENYGDFILINTRFPIYNHYTGLRNTKLNPGIQYMKNLFESFLTMITELAEEFPAMNIVIRPHPGESFSTYKQQLSNYKNIHVIHEGNVINWLLASRVVIHNGCTTGIEAFLLRKPVIAYLPFTCDSYDVELPNKLSVVAYNTSEIIDFVQLYSSSSGTYTPHNPTANTYLSYFYGVMDDRYSYEKIIRLLNQITIRNKPFNGRGSYQSASDSRKQSYKFTTLTIEQIRSFFKKIDVIDNANNNVIINKIDENLFDISLSIED